LVLLSITAQRKLEIASANLKLQLPTTLQQQSELVLNLKFQFPIALQQQSE